METPNQPLNSPATRSESVQGPSWVPRVLIGGLITLTIFLTVGISTPTHLVANVPGNRDVAVVSAAVSGPFENTSLLAKSAIVVDIQSGATLFARNPDIQLPLASLTKVPLALVVSEVLPLDSRITIPHDIPQVGKFETLSGGVQWPLQEVIDFTLITSSNDGADILAEAANGPVRQKFSGAPTLNSTLWRMNALANELGLSQTYFLNVSGLDISTTLAGAYGSARDVAILFEYASQSNPTVFSGTARGNVLLTSEYGDKQTVAYNTNETEAEIPGLILGKTGFTDLAGGNLAIVFDVGIAHPVVVVILGSTKEGRFEDARKLVEATRAAIALQ